MTFLAQKSHFRAKSCPNFHRRAFQIQILQQKVDFFYEADGFFYDFVFPFHTPYLPKHINTFSYMIHVENQTQLHQ